MSESHQSARPVHLNLLRFHFPLPAVTSITHRITGIALFLGVWVLLYLAHDALAPLASERSLTEAPLGKLILFALCACASFHVLAGIKHLLLDLGIGEGLKAARVFSAAVWVLSGLVSAAFATLALL